MNEPLFIYSENLLDYKFHDSHPFNQLRVKLTYDLLKASGHLSDTSVVKPRKASDEEIMLIHDKGYIEAVKKAGEGSLSSDIAGNYGLGTEDTPSFKGMHDAGAWIVGATLTAADLVMEGKTKHALSLSGGLHHGFRGKASGFCIYNDSSIVIEYIRRKYGVRVLYVDSDAHHGDGVQWAFYDDSDVCTLSIHETGRYLFPGTGNVHEKGQGSGYGFSFNVPVDAFTEDESWLHCYETSLLEVADYFKPDVIVTQNGADAHCYDPLTHLSVTMKTYEAMPRLAKKIADRYCGGRWIATGGGGYDIWRVVPRAWANIWLAMNGIQESGNLPAEWLAKWSRESPVELPRTWSDSPDIYTPIPRKPEITAKNEDTLAKTLYSIRSLKKKNG
ncbi:acetoin utilization protein AcuC [Fictibacillus aquaticus]|uniref:Acetoin utilization protein AcuC n=1 Tax=Fictibacillus aquaticus TaxID=2021314 RepID=A0A235FB97_9BACL|nr:acetoin utilization protein AcuC [Fictibacillus aquaticus]OYD58227.1 acetoin utilization protein AcuC [Fictibacillus aquaticus]